MKIIKFLVAVLLAATGMTSCSNNDNEAENSNKRVEVKFTSAQASMNTRVTGTEQGDDEHIGIYMLTADPVYSLEEDNISEGVNNREYETASSKATVSFTPTEEANRIYYPADRDGQGVNVKFIAYYPHGAVTDDFKRAIDVSDQKTSQSAIDFLYAPLSSSEYNKNIDIPVDLQFKHKLVKLVFDISNGTGVSAALTGLKVEITKQETLSALDLTDGNVAVSAGGEETIEALTAENGTSSEAIVLPLQSTGDVKFVFTNTAGEEFTGTVPANWIGGYKYTYTVKLNKITTGIIGTIDPWIDIADTVDANNYLLKQKQI
jgi:hypothetical protein